GIGFVVARARRAALAPEPDADPWSPAPPELSERRLEPMWVEPIAGECPPTHVVKGKLTSGIYHLPGMTAYARTKPDRCYLDAAARAWPVRVAHDDHVAGGRGLDVVVVEHHDAGLASN